MKKSVKFFLIALIIAAAAAGSYYYMTMPLAVRLTEIRPQIAELSFTEQGLIVADYTVLVFPVMQGELTHLYVREGQEINSGDVLAAADDTALRIRVTQVRNNIRSLQAQLNNLVTEQDKSRSELTFTRDSLLGELRAIDAQSAESDWTITNQNEAIEKRLRIQNSIIEQNKRDLERIRADFARIESLYKRGAVTKVEFENSQSSVSQAETTLKVSQNELAVIAAESVRSKDEYFDGMRKSLQAKISGIEHQLLQDYTLSMAAHFNALIAAEQNTITMLERDIENCVITAPVSGIITTLHVKNSNVINPTTPVAEITVPGKQNIEVYISTQDIISISSGDRVELTLKQRMDDVKFHGTVINIDKTAVLKYSVLGIEERRVKVTVSPEMPPVQLGIGYGIDVTFFVYREENRYTVPRTAVFKDNDQDMVWVVRNGDFGKVSTAAVEIGRELRTRTVIESGLYEGDYVVNDANNKDLRVGARVKNLK